MNLKKMCAIFMVLCYLMMLTACSIDATTREDTTTEESTLQVVATTTMLHDLCMIVGGEKVQSQGLIAVGIDPHSYQPSAGDTNLLEGADVIVYHGLHLEGKMGELLAHMETQNKYIITVEDGIDPETLLVDEEDATVPDPHIWFDPFLWMDATYHIAQELGKKNPENQAYYESNARTYVEELKELDLYIQECIGKIPEESRVLITAHDAFQYFANRYGFEVQGIQGIATNAEATTADISTLADFIVERQIKAVFVESSVSSKNMEALQEAVMAQGFMVEIGGELYSDSLGTGEHGSYIGTYRGNIETIVVALGE